MGGDFPPRNLLLNLASYPPWEWAFRLPLPFGDLQHKWRRVGGQELESQLSHLSPHLEGLPHSAEPQQGENLPGSPSTRRPLPNSEQVTRPPHPQGAIQGPPPITEPSPRLSPTQSSEPLLGRGPQGPGPPRALGRPGTLQARPRSRPPLDRHPILGAVSLSPGTEKDESGTLIGRRPLPPLSANTEPSPRGTPVLPGPPSRLPQVPRCLRT